jgi:hypothetical protein
MGRDGTSAIEGVRFGRSRRATRDAGEGRIAEQRGRTVHHGWVWTSTLLSYRVV